MRGADRRVAPVGEADVDEPVNPLLVEDQEADRLRGELAVEAAGIGTFDWDLVTGRLDWDDRLIELFGYDADTFDRSIEGFNDRLHPDDLARVTQALQTAIDSCGGFDSVYRVCLPGGETRWVSARGRTLCDPDGTAVRLLGAAYDITDQRDAELGVTRVLEAMPAGFYSLDREWRFTHVNAAAERLLMRSRDELLGEVIWDAFPAAVNSVFEDSYRRAVAAGVPVSFHAHYPAPLNGWYELRAWPNPDGLAVYFIEVTDAHLATQRAQQAADRLALLARVSRELSETLGMEAATQRVPELITPLLGDACIVTVLDVHGRPREVGSWHERSELRPLLAAYARARRDDLAAIEPIARLMVTGERHSVSGQGMRDLVPAGEAHDLLERLDLTWAVMLPLRGRGRTVGLLTLGYAGGREPSDDDLALAQEIADRVGLALDNARLYGQQRALAEQLQRSFLTEPPEPDHAEVVVRYLPAAEAAAVGGDWYDAFLQPDGATMIVIGDVAGHDTAAAATMGQLRSLLRGIATSHDEAGPADVLRRLDSSMALLQVNTLATAAVARLEQDLDERHRGVTRLRWSNAGHLPPIVIDPHGTVTPLAQFGRAELLLGVDPSARRTDAVVTLDRGSTVLLFTDGLVERRDADLDEGIERLRAALADVAHLPLQELCDVVIDRLVHGRPDDDVALVAVRLHRQDRPRPAEAGPRRIPGPVPSEPGVP
jgi:serine phosphatase RsbU (regulator of sigma subunit)/PAS domain-containing protein